MFGVGNHKDFRNIVFLACNIEKAFDMQRITFVLGEYSVKLIILDPNIMNEKIYPLAERTIGDFKGKEMKFPEQVNLPYRHVLSYHAKWAYSEALKKGWINNCNAFENFSFSPMYNINLKTIRSMEPPQ
jgi:hypothetical protein